MISYAYDRQLEKNSFEGSYPAMLQQTLSNVWVLSYLQVVSWGRLGINLHVVDVDRMLIISWFLQAIRLQLPEWSIACDAFAIQQHTVSEVFAH